MLWSCRRVQAALARAAVEGRELTDLSVENRHLRTCARCQEERAALLRTVWQLRALRGEAPPLEELVPRAARGTGLRPALADLCACAAVAGALALLLSWPILPSPRATRPGSRASSGIIASTSERPAHAPATARASSSRTQVERSTDARQDRARPPVRRRRPIRRTWLACQAMPVPTLASGQPRASLPESQVGGAGAPVLTQEPATQASVATAAYVEHLGDLEGTINQIAQVLAPEHEDQRSSSSEGPRS